MNKPLLIFFLLIPISCVGMEQASIYRRIGISSQKRDTANDLTFEKAMGLIEAECKSDHLKHCLKAFARTYLRTEVQKNYTQMKQELDVYCRQAEHLSLVCDFVIIMKAAIDNWDTASPGNVFKYTDRVEHNFMVFLKDDYFLGLKDPRSKDKQQ